MWRLMFTLFCLFTVLSSPGAVDNLINYQVKNNTGCVVTAEFNFDQAFQTFLRSNNYNGAQVGIMVDGKMVFVKGYGENRESHHIHNASSVPISALSKAFTAVATIKLVEEGKIDRNAKVFGQDGILHTLKPWDPEQVDQRIYDITVDNLLRHTGGWDSQHSKLFDPVLNTALLSRGYNVKDIAKLMNLTEGLTPYDIITFMMSEPLEFTPGTRSVISNLGYLILGKVIEEKIQLPYQEYVKKHILNPCGMMHTRIKRPHINHEDKSNEPIYDGHGKVNPLFVDSALGWESNVYDMIRFSQCLDGSADFMILDQLSLNTLLAKPRNVHHQSESWIAAGFHTNSHGSIWMEGEEYTDELLFFHRGPLRSNEARMRGRATSWVVLLDGHTFTPIRNMINVMVNAEFNWPSSNHLLDDVADVHVHNGEHERIIKAKLNEHHIDAYFHALAQLRYDVKWANGYTHDENTYFSVVAEKSHHKIYDKVIVEHGLTERHLRLQKRHHQERGYNLTLLQNYYSYSHDKRNLFLAVFRYHAYTNKTNIKYGMQHYTQSYRKLLELYVEEGYVPTSESLVFNGYDGLVSFILRRDEEGDHAKKVDFKEYEGMSLTRLEKTLRSNARHERKLAYLDSSNYFGKPKFSAVFIKDPSKKWSFNGSLNESDLKTAVTREQSRGLLPKILDGFKDKEGNLKFVLYME